MDQYACTCKIHVNVSDMNMDCGRLCSHMLSVNYVKHELLIHSITEGLHLLQLFYTDHESPRMDKY